MEYIYAAMLLHKAGKPVEEEAMEKVLSAAGMTADKARIKATVTALKDVDIDKVIKEASAFSAAPVAAGPAQTASKPAEKPKEEEKKVTDEEAAAGLGALFG